MGRRSHRKIKQRKRMILPHHPRSNKGDTGSRKVKTSKIEISPDCRPLWRSVHREALKQASPSARVEMYESMGNVVGKLVSKDIVYPRVRESRPFDEHEDFFQYTLNLHKRIQQRMNRV